MSRRYLAAMCLFVVLAVVFGLVGTIAPTPELVSPQQSSSSSSSSSVTHFAYPPSFDSGWVNITDKAGCLFTLRHELNTTNVTVYITTKQSLEEMSYTPAWEQTPGLWWYPLPACCHSMIQMSNGEYALAGYTNTYMPGHGDGGLDFYLVKTDSSGRWQWENAYGGASDDACNSMVQTSDGGFALAGYTHSYGAGGGDMWLVKTDSFGRKQWNITYGGTGYEEAYCIVKTGDGGYALAGYTDSFGAGSEDFWLVKTNSSGYMQWNRTYGGASSELATSLVQTSDGGYAIGGLTRSYGGGGSNFYLVKTDSSGIMQWNKTYGGINTDICNSMVQTNDGGFALAGYTHSYGAGGNDFWLVKTDSSGIMQWNKTYGGINTDICNSMVQTVDEGYALAGYTSAYANGTGLDFWLVRTDGGGNMVWNKTYFLPTVPREQQAFSVIQTSDFGYALAGYTDAMGELACWFVKTIPMTNLENLMSPSDNLTCVSLANDTITLRLGSEHPHANYVRVRIWLIKEPTWQFGDINQDGKVDIQDLYIVSRNYGKTFSLLSFSGIIAIAGIQNIKTRRKSKQPD